MESIKFHNARRLGSTKNQQTVIDKVSKLGMSNINNGSINRNKLETFLIENNIQSFLYKNICQNGNTVVIFGSISGKRLALKYIDPKKIDNITSLELSEFKSAFAFKKENIWTLSELTIPVNYMNGTCPDITNSFTDKEIDHITEVAYEHISFSGLEGASKRFAGIQNEILKQLNNPFYDDVNLCIKLTVVNTSKKTTKNNSTKVEPIDGNFNQSIRIPALSSSKDFTKTFKKNDKPCDIGLDIAVNANGELSIKHLANPNYLKEFEGKWEKEIRKRGLQDEIDIKELREQVLKDFENAETEHNFIERFVQDTKAFFNSEIGGYIEAIQATQKVAKHVWKEGTISRGTWHSTGADAEEHKNFPEYMHINGYVGGATDGVIDEIVGIPMAIKGVYGIVTDSKQREALAKVFTKEGFGQLMDNLSKQAKGIAGDTERQQHFAGQTTISVGSMMLPGMQITKLGVLSNTLTGVKTGLATITSAKVLEVLDNLRKARRYKPEILKAIEDFMKELDPQIIGKIADIPGFDKVLQEMAQQWKKFHGSKFMFRHLEGKGDDFIKKIKEFEAKIIDNANFAADVKLVDGGFLEYKSWKKATFSLLSDNQAQKQLKNYLKSGNFEYIVDRAKLVKDGVLNADEFVKGKFQRVFQNNADEWFKSIENGGVLLDENTLIKLFDTSNLDDIIDILDDIDSDFYKKIIKVE